MGEDEARERPVVQDSKYEGHVEIDMPDTGQRLIVGDEIARRMAGDIRRILDSREDGEAP